MKPTTVLVAHVVIGAWVLIGPLEVSSPRPGPAAEPGSPAASAEATQSACLPGSIHLFPGDDVVGIVNGAVAGTSFCFHGIHRVSETLVPKDNQSWVGVDNARLTGAERLGPWALFETGVWRYDGPLAAVMNIRDEFTSTGKIACNEVSIYQDDVFYDDQRMMRVLSLDQLRGIEALPQGQAETEGEFGRFFFDYDNDRIYIDQDPAAAFVELALLDKLIQSAADGVRLRNLILEKALTNIVDGLGSTSWIIDGVTIRFAHNTGIHAGHGKGTKPYIIRNSRITNNGQGGILAGGSFIHVLDTELSWNNIVNYRVLRESGECGSMEGTAGARFFRNIAGTETIPGLVISGVDVHHNITDGIHVDIHSIWVRITDSSFHDNEKSGLAHEISCATEVAFNQFTGNGLALKNTDQRGAGVILFVSNDANIHDNIFAGNTHSSVFLSLEPHDNLTGISCMNISSDTDTSDALKHNVVERNTMEMCLGASAGGKVPLTLAIRDNWFRDNTYILEDNTTPWWRDRGLPALLYFDEWQATGQGVNSVTFNGAQCQ